MHKKLIINADDFGMSEEVNEGTKKGIEAGIITSVSVMVNMPYFEDAVKFLKKHPEISVGLHFNLTEGKSEILPIQAGALIREDDHFYYWPQLLAKVALRSISKKTIDEELKAQYSRLRKTGLKVSHIDSHHHVHLFPTIFDVVTKFAQKNEIRSLRGHDFNTWNLTLGLGKMPTRTQIEVNAFLALVNIRHGDRKKLYKIDRFYDINWGIDMTKKEFIDVLEALPEGTTEFICHLAVVSKTGNKKFLAPRFKALQMLTNSNTKRVLTENGITLISHPKN